ncbi:hypothetical protein CC80DRAFT_569081, partial [Byssothecium circinans]
NLLKKIDKLRELTVPSIDLPQLVVVGDQSSGKSSLLESLTGFSFPQAAGLCTRYATQISCHRKNTRSTTVSIIPRPNAEEELSTKLRAFKHTVSEPTSKTLKAIMEAAERTMGIRPNIDETSSDLLTFSGDILKIEISGSDQEHFTVIDVPGIFRVPSPPVTTDSDVALVRHMVERYMQNSRTIILAVLPSNVDITTQEILKMAENTYPKGIRTMGILTKPELATETATQNAIKDVVLNKRNGLRLEYYTSQKSSATISAVPVSSLNHLVVDKENTQQVREDILDVLFSYYKVSRTRFVEVICSQVIGHLLLHGEQSRLKIFTSELVMGLDAEQLEMIAGEDAETKNRRTMLETEIVNLDAAMKVVRTLGLSNFLY